MGASENEKLELNITATIKFSFGTICDRVQSVLENHTVLTNNLIEYLVDGEHIGVSEEDEIRSKIGNIIAAYAARNTTILQREARNQGNNSIRVIENHMQHFKVLRRHNLDKTNVERIAKRHEKGSSSGDFKVQREAEND
jgi:hypothetical protein